MWLDYGTLRSQKNSAAGSSLASVPGKSAVYTQGCKSGTDFDAIFRQEQDRRRRSDRVGGWSERLVASEAGPE